MVDELFERFRGEMSDCLLFTNNVRTITLSTINAGDRQLTRRYSATLRMSDHDRAVRQQFRRDLDAVAADQQVRAIQGVSQSVEYPRACQLDGHRDDIGLCVAKRV